MPSTDRRLELKAKDIDGSDRLTAGCVLIDLASPAVSQTAVYANGLKERKKEKKKERNKQTKRCCKLHKPLKGITLEDQCHNRCPTLLFSLMAPAVLPKSGRLSRPHVRYSTGSSLGEAATLNQRLCRGGLGPRLLTACLRP